MTKWFTHETMTLAIVVKMEIQDTFAAATFPHCSHGVEL